ncbi:hypothetical protein [Zooshikella ganghwensis]|uniref:DUF3108 domain-containing protein n=1 Tax=Zooshikella ganghwensis TaxID=202772 RepID=A0A4P9VGT8_9GAMM|nr:hypothetical protein [Zooshikella ganghwensis]RDH41473.1 hypothetical protein B9G39_28060 [Zooshikella ganghwensis]RDH41579.1 hypothetical protein B9G39_27925 [Zooshikella ganghwensis]
MNKIISLSPLIVLLFLIPFFSGCSSNILGPKLSSSKSYDRYDLKIGDTWDAKVISEDSIERIIATVTDDKTSSNSYLTKLDIHINDFDRVITGHGKIDKENLELIELDATFVKDGIPIRITQKNEYIYTDNTRFPIKVGKKWEVLVTETKRIMEGNEVSKESSTKKIRYEVSSIDTITVEAGTFQCFKINVYEDDKFVSVYWQSPETKFISVKEVNYEKNESHELQNYKVRW